MDDNLLGNLLTSKKPQAKPSDAIRVDVMMDPKLLQMGGEECNINTRATFGTPLASLMLKSMLIPVDEFPQR